MLSFAFPGCIKLVIVVLRPVNLKLLSSQENVNFTSTGDRSRVFEMFLSKVRWFANPVAKGLTDNLRHRGLSAVVSGALQSTNEKPPVPDKLYSKIELELRSNERAVLKSYAKFVNMTAHHLNVEITRTFSPEKAVHERLTVLKAVHIYKKHRVQYETRTYFLYIDAERLTGSTADTFLEYIQRNLPEGVAMKVTKVEIQRLPESVSPSGT